MLMLFYFVSVSIVFRSCACDFTPYLSPYNNKTVAVPDSVT